MSNDASSEAKAVHWQTADGEVVTTFKSYHGTHQGTFLGVAPTGRKIHFEAVDAMRVHEGKITEHWGAANLFSLMQQRASPDRGPSRSLPSRIMVTSPPPLRRQAECGAPDWPAPTA